MRKSGVLMHISSLASPYGIGTLGKEAYAFVDFLEKSGQSYWQLLPVCPTSYGDSPYQSYSVFAGNPYFIDLEMLAEKKLLEISEYENIDWGSDETCVDYSILYKKRYPLLYKAAKQFLKNPPSEFEMFCRKNEFWLSDFALFMTLKDVNKGVSWTKWSAAFRNRDKRTLARFVNEYQSQINCRKAIQYLFFEQWERLKNYANKRGISIIGDLPIYVSFDSVDVWTRPEVFWLDKNKNPAAIAGVPPDGFSADGQLWGNPLFDWEYMESEGFKWWIKRIAYLCKMYDVLRIDHFRGFDSYYAIPYGEITAKNGCWKKGPGMKLFRAVEKVIGKKDIIAEDLGYLTESVKILLKESGFPGMKVLQFAFDSRDLSGKEYLPENYEEHCVAYVGTHDNDTIKGWFEEAAPKDAAYCKEYLQIAENDKLHWGMMEAIWRSRAKLTIVQAQDLLGLGSKARMNRPGTIGNNWMWRAVEGAFSNELAAQLKEKMKLYNRN